MFTRLFVGRMATSLGRHIIWESEGLVAYLHPRPWTPGSVILESRMPGKPGGSIFQLEELEYLSWLLGARAVSKLLCDKLDVRRCAMVARPHEDRPAQICVLPLHGLEDEWCPHLSGGPEHHAHDPGYCTSKNATRWEDSCLSEVQSKIRAKLPNPKAEPNLTFLGEDPSHPGLFPRIIRGEEQQWRLWEDHQHVSFLTPFPNSPGLTVLIPRRPLTSDIFKLDREDYEGLVLAARKVSGLLVDGLGAWGVGLIFEGYEIDYAHAKLIPLLRQASGMRGISCARSPQEFHDKYPGYVTSEDGPDAGPECLGVMHEKITRI